MTGRESLSLEEGFVAPGPSRTVDGSGFRACAVQAARVLFAPPILDQQASYSCSQPTPHGPGFTRVTRADCRAVRNPRRGRL